MGRPQPTANAPTTLGRPTPTIAPAARVAVGPQATTNRPTRADPAAPRKSPGERPIDPSQNTARLATPPTTLPALREIQLGDTLAGMATVVYGRQSYTLLDMIQAANPGLDDPSRIIAGGVVLFPSLDAANRIVPGADGQLRVIALTTPSLRRALARQSELQKSLGRLVEIETVSLYDGPDLYRVFLPSFSSPDIALRTAQSLGPLLSK